MPRERRPFGVPLLAGLSTIQDYDIGVGDVEHNRIVRLRDFEDAKLPSESELYVIIWLLFELGVDKVDRLIRSKKLENLTELERTESDVVDSKRSSRAVCQAKSLAEKHMKSVGLDLPFSQFEENTRVFLQFCSSSDVLEGKSFCSVEEVFKFLRRRNPAFYDVYDKINPIGYGSYGEVFTVRRKNETDLGNILAAKRVEIDALNEISDVVLTLTEFKILKKLSRIQRHENVIQYLGCWLEISESSEGPCESLFFTLLMDRCYMDLTAWQEEVNKYRPISQEKLISIMTQINNGLSFIHSHGIMHLDLNPKNVLWADENLQTIKIADFGLARMEKEYNHRCGTVPYFCSNDNPMTNKSDMYSLGVTMLELASRSRTKAQLIHLCGNNIFRNSADSQHLEQEYPFLWGLLEELLQINAKNRPSSAEFKTRLIETFG